MIVLPKCWRCKKRIFFMAFWWGSSRKATICPWCCWELRKTQDPLVLVKVNNNWLEMKGIQK